MLEVIQNLLKKYDENIWIMYNKENSDKYFCKYIHKNLSTKTIAVITKEKIYIIVHALDAQNIIYADYDKNKVCILIYDDIKINMKNVLEDVIAELKFPKEVSFSYSTMGDAKTDVLTHGDYVYLSKFLKDIYKKYLKKVRIVSAEKLMYALASQKTKKQIERLKLLSGITNTILEETFNSLKVGMSEIEIASHTLKVMRDITSLYINSNDIITFDIAWENCPIVLTGVNLAKGGHSIPSQKKLLRGDTIYFDFGIKAIFEDGETLYTDMQRMGYALAENEVFAPKDVMRVFNTLVDAIEDGIDQMRPEVKGKTIDAIVRRKILKENYPDYNHATGHRSW
ncbi:MAG: M24 family metallopeptidase [Clostridia bacterium]